MIILVISSYFLIRDFWEHKKSNDSSIELIENVITEEKTEKDKEERKKQIDYSVKQKVITQEEADKLY